jgi:mono/diheme cytochrome c family protein
MFSSKLFLGLSFLFFGSVVFQYDFLEPNYIDTYIQKERTSVLNSSGKEIYTDFCMQCHGANGKGDAKNFPLLDGSDWLTTKRTQSIAAVKYGLSGEIRVNKVKYNSNMPAMGLSDQEVADVMNYIMTSWSNKQVKPVTVKEVAAVKK